MIRVWATVEFVSNTFFPKDAGNKLCQVNSRNGERVEMIPIDSFVCR